MRETKSSKLIFIRHAEKDSGTRKLTDVGRKKAREHGVQFEERELEIYHSNILRAKQTAEEIASIPTLQIVKFEELPDLSEEPFTDEEFKRLKLEPGLWLWPETPSEDLPSTKTLAGRIARIIIQHIDSDNTKLFISHLPPIMLFIRWGFETELGITSENVLQKLGGFTKPLHGFEVLRDGTDILVRFEQFAGQDNLWLPLHLTRKNLSILAKPCNL